MAESLLVFMNPWCARFPQSQAFSFFFSVHHLYSRIDCFFIDRGFLPCVTRTEHLAIVELDHAPVLLDLTFSLRSEPLGD